METNRKLRLLRSQRKILLIYLGIVLGSLPHLLHGSILDNPFSIIIFLGIVIFIRQQWVVMKVTK